MDKQNKPQRTSEDELAAPAQPVGPLHARSPYRPLSRRKRLEQVAEVPPAVERPIIRTRFDATPLTISAALARATASFEEPVLVWRPTSPIEDDVSVETDGDEDDDGA